MMNGVLQALQFATPQLADLLVCIGKDDLPSCLACCVRAPVADARARRCPGRPRLESLRSAQQALAGWDALARCSRTLWQQCWGQLPGGGLECPDDMIALLCRFGFAAAFRTATAARGMPPSQLPAPPEWCYIGDDVDVRGSALHSAVLSRSTRMLEVALAACPDPTAVNTRNGRHQTPLYVACSHKAGLGANDRVLKLAQVLLSARADPDTYSGSVAGPRDSGSVCSDFFNNQTPLTTACRNRDTGLVKLLLHHRADVNNGACYGESSSPVCVAVARGVVLLDERRAAYDAETRAELVELLLAASASADGPHPHDAEDHGHRPALWCAARDDRSGLLVSLLLRNRADPNQPDYFGDTPLHIAYATGRAACVRALLAAGADTCARDRDGKLPTEVACTVLALADDATIEDIVATGTLAKGRRRGHPARSDLSLALL